MDIIINGVSFIAIVFGVVEFTKKLGAKGNLLTALSMVIGVVLGTCQQIATMYPDFGVWFGVVVYGLAVGLAASGIYDFVNGKIADKA